MLNTASVKPARWLILKGAHYRRMRRRYLRRCYMVERVVATERPSQNIPWRLSNDRLTNETKRDSTNRNAPHLPHRTDHHRPC